MESCGSTELPPSDFNDFQSLDSPQVLTAAPYERYKRGAAASAPASPAPLFPISERLGSKYHNTLFAATERSRTYRRSSGDHQVATATLTFASLNQILVQANGIPRTSRFTMHEQNTPGFTQNDVDATLQSEPEDTPTKMPPSRIEQ